MFRKDAHIDPQWPKSTTKLNQINPKTAPGSQDDLQVIPEKSKWPQKELSGGVGRALGPFWAPSWIPRTAPTSKNKLSVGALGPHMDLGTICYIKNAKTIKHRVKSWSRADQGGLRDLFCVFSIVCTNPCDCEIYKQPDVSTNA